VATIQLCKGCGCSLPAESPDELCPQCRVQGGRKEPPSPVVRETVLLTEEAFLQASKTQPASMDLPVLERLGGYRIIRLLGKGGMGAVYEAEEIESGRRVALKVLSQSLDSPEARRRFFREGRLAASVNHPNTVYVFGTDEIDGRPVIIMELVSCGTLQDRVKHHEPMPVAQAVDAILQVIAGLEAAAALGVLHRDVKPSNCFVEEDGTVKVGDFGLSVSTAVRGETKLTMTGSFLGTPAFSSPEQLRGDEFTIQGDIYAVGVTLYYLLTGRTPFEGDDLVRMLATVLERVPDSPAQTRPELPKGLCRAVLRCLEKQPAKRFRRYGELRKALLPYSSAAASPATLSLRFLAACMDGILLSLVSMAVAFLLTARHWVVFSNEMPELLTTIFATMVNVLYYAVLEGRWGASLGKRICGLRVVGPHRAVPGVPRALGRAIIVELLPAVPGILLFWFSYLPHPSPTSALKVGGLSNVSYVILALLFSTARRRNGFAAVQDLVTRTRVVRRPSHAARPRLEVAEDIRAAENSASRLGPYHVLESLARSDAGEMLLGYDTRLLRKVWIRKLPAGTPPLLPCLRNLARVGRLRWLDGKRTSEECWDAYEAAPGRSLTDLIERTQPWNLVRFWLLDLAEEISAGQKDQTLPAILQLDRVWITADGRAKLLDFSAPGSHAARITSGSSPELFLNQVAAAALAGAAVADPQPASVPVPLPFHARELLQEMQTGLSPSLLAERLKPLLQNLAVVSRGRRLGLIVGCSLVPLILGGSIYAGIVLAQRPSAQTDLAQITTLRESLRQWTELQAGRNLPGGLDGQGDSYSSNLLGPSLTWNGIPFKFGTGKGPDVVTAIGQTMPLPPGHFTNLALLAAAVDGNHPSQVLTINYADKTSSKWTQSFSDWFTPQQYSGESNALTMAYRNKGDGTQDRGNFHLYGYMFELESSRTVQSLTLPRNPNIAVLALTLAPPATMVDLSSEFNQPNGIAADGVQFSFKASQPAREAYEVYLAGHFRETITNLASINEVGGIIPRDQGIAAQKLMAARSAPSDQELKEAAAVVEPNLKGETLNHTTRSFDMFSHPLILYSLINPFLWLGALPSFLAALLGGGLVLRMLGLAVVKKDGSKASGWRMLWRSFIAWSPLLIMGPLAELLLPIASLSSWERVLLNLGYIILVAVLMICAALLPERGLQDRLAGTCLVPRD
jgi:uncharacterized RDD family membrane protein YckC